MLTTRQLITTLAAAAGLVWTVATASTAEAPKDSDCLLCHEDKTLASTNASGQVKLLYVDAATLKASAHSTNACASCHRDVTDKHPDDGVAPKPVNCADCHERLSESYNASVHALALKAGDAAAPLCRDCHGSHEILPPTDPASPLHPSNLSQTCGGCHDQAAAAVQASVHGRGTATGEREAATCIDCHSEHAIEQLKTNATLKVSADVCSRCHASERINTKFNLPKDRVETFFESYHGLASQYGSTLAANCASCHGYHLVLPSADPKSSINTNNLVATCGKCHPGATQYFVAGKIHVNTESADGIGGLINQWVRRIYLVLIFGTIGFMLAHNGGLWLRKIAKYYRDGTRTVLRMDLWQRWQHSLLVGSFIALAVTGFALKWPESWIAKLLGSHEDFRRWSHRVAGIIMLTLGVYHVLYLIFSQKGRQLFKDFLPVKKDAADLVQTTRYLVGHAKERPKIGRFGYAEKMEYWAVAWGTIIMGVTGLAIWFKIDVTQFLPRWIVEVATTIHYYEAILACLAIIVWHFYHVMLDPDVYPVNFAFWDGKVSKHWQEEEHPLDHSVPGTQAPAETSSTPSPGQERPTKPAEPGS